MRFGSLLRVRPLGLHPFTWLAGLVVGLALVLIMVPGEVWDWRHQGDTWDARECEKAVFSAIDRYRGRAFFSTPDVCVYVHGWPMPCAVRARGPILDSTVDERSEPKLRFAASAWTPLYEPDPGAISWSNYDNWPFHSDELRVRPLGIFVNSLAGLFVLGFVLSGCELWLRRRGGVLRFRILDLMVGVAIVAGMLGYRQWHLNCQRAEMDLVNELELVNDGNGYFFVDAFSAGPEWLVRLVGNEELVPYFVRHVAVVEFALLGPEKIKRLEELPYLKGVCVSAPLSREEIEALWGVRRLEYLDLSYHGNGWGYKEGGPLRLSRPASPTSSEIEALCKLPIITLKLHAPALTLSGLEQLVTCPTLRTLHLHRADISPEEIEGVRRRHPDLRIVSQSE